jgi:hypothetical protein
MVRGHFLNKDIRNQLIQRLYRDLPYLAISLQLIEYLNPCNLFINPFFRDPCLFLDLQFPLNFSFDFFQPRITPTILCFALPVDLLPVLSPTLLFLWPGIFSLKQVCCFFGNIATSVQLLKLGISSALAFYILLVDHHF